MIPKTSDLGKGVHALEEEVFSIHNSGKIRCLHTKEQNLICVCVCVHLSVHVHNTEG